MTARRNKKHKGDYRLPVFITFLVACIAAAGSFVLSSVYPQNGMPDNTVEEKTEHARWDTEDIPGRTEEPEEPIQYCHWEMPRLLTARSEQIIGHLAYTVSYNHDWHLPNWVAYELTAHELQGENSRSDKFLPDPAVKGNPVVTKDYSGSGYDRGHMAPAGDMRWSDQAMKESFYMTNMCPQNHSNNAGDWKDLEELVRDLAAKHGNIYICCGPIVTDTSNTIGSARKIVVPQAFYKVLLRCKKDGTWTSIGFVMPNAAGSRPLMTYMQSVDEVEQLAGIDFFYLLPDSVEYAIEADYTIADWNVK